MTLLRLLFNELNKFLLHRQAALLREGVGLCVTSCLNLIIEIRLESDCEEWRPSEVYENLMCLNLTYIIGGVQTYMRRC